MNSSSNSSSSSSSSGSLLKESGLRRAVKDSTDVYGHFTSTNQSLPGRLQAPPPLPLVASFGGSSTSFLHIPAAAPPQISSSSMSLAPVPSSRVASPASDPTPKVLPKSSARAPISTYLPRSITDPAQPLPRAAQGHSTRPLGPAALPKPQTGRKVSEGLAKHASTCSSAVAMEEYRTATSEFPPGKDGEESRRVFLVKRRADEARAQQLRGIFASHDSDRDGLITMA
jgi:hypothetical protein